MIKSFAGQELKLFRGGNVTMGSSRRDAGRRANEVLREATLSRPFYLGTKEVTNGEFRRFLANHTLEPINGVDVNGDNHPVDGLYQLDGLGRRWKSVCAHESLGRSLSPSARGEAYRLQLTALRPGRPIPVP